MSKALAVLVLACTLSIALGYSTSGNKILDPNGNVIVLRGVARPSLEWSAVGENLGLSDYQKIKEWGSNVVRIGLSQCFWISGLNGYASGYKSTVAQQVAWAKSLGLGVIIDLHWSNKGQSGNGCGQQTMPDSYSTTFWTDVATIYKNDPYVIFEIYNEPHDVSWSVWRNGGDAGGFTTPGFQALYNAIRATGANNAVIVNGLNYAYDLSGVSGNALSGTNIIYGTHPYDFGGKQQGDWPSGFGYLAPTYPLIATEFGNFNCDPTYNTNFINYAATLGMSWTAWGWYVQGCGFPSIIADWNGNPSAIGVPVKNALASSASSTTKSATSSASTTKSATTATSSTTSTSSTTKTSTSTTTGSSTTGGASANTFIIYADGLQNGYSDWSWVSTKNLADSSRKHSGTVSASFVPTGYQALYFQKTAGIDTSKHASIEFWVNGGPNGGQNIQVNLLRGSSGVVTGPDQPVSYYAGTIPSGSTWNKGTINLSNFPAGTYDGIWFQDKSGGTQGTVYVDDIKVNGK